MFPSSLRCVYAITQTSRILFFSPEMPCALYNSANLNFTINISYFRCFTMCSAFMVFYLINYYCEFMFHVRCFISIKVKSSFFKKLFSIHILYTINTVLVILSFHNDGTCHHRMNTTMISYCSCCTK